MIFVRLINPFPMERGLDEDDMLPCARVDRIFEQRNCLLR